MVHNSIRASLYGFALLAASLLAACSAKPVVVLLPEADGTVGTVWVTNDAGTQQLDQAYGVVEFDPISGAPLPQRAADSEEIAEDFAAVLNVEPMPPAIFSFKFKSDSADMLGDMTSILDSIVTAFQDRTPSKISIVGHTDRAGARAYNLHLSLRRAEAVQKELAARSVPIDAMDVSSHGENNPIIRTNDGVAEPRNRRVEVIVK